MAYLQPAVLKTVKSFDLKDTEQAQFVKTVTCYSQDLSLSWLVYRIWNAVKSIFGQSDWQISKKNLKKKASYQEDIQEKSKSLPLLLKFNECLAEATLKLLTLANGSKLDNEVITKVLDLVKF